MDTFIKLLADGSIILLALIALYMLIARIDRRRWYETYSYVLLAGLASYALAKFISLWYQPETLRPFEKLGLEAGAAYLNNPGFPSDHALFGMFLIGAVWYATRRWRVVAVMASLLIVMCVGRVVALVHTPLDVVGGVAIAVAGMLCYPPVRQKLRTFISSQKSKYIVK